MVLGTNTLVGFQDVSLVKLNLSALPSDAVILDATMCLYLETADWCETANLAVYFIASLWDETSITWNSAASLTTNPTGSITNLDDVTGSYKDFPFMKAYVQS